MAAEPLQARAEVEAVQVRPVALAVPEEQMVLRALQVQARILVQEVQAVPLSVQAVLPVSTLAHPILPDELVPEEQQVALQSHTQPADASCSPCLASKRRTVGPSDSGCWGSGGGHAPWPMPQPEQRSRVQGRE